MRRLNHQNIAWIHSSDGEETKKKTQNSWPILKKSGLSCILDIVEPFAPPHDIQLKI